MNISLFFLIFEWQKRLSIFYRQDQFLNIKFFTKAVTLGLSNEQRLSNWRREKRSYF